MNRQKRRAAKLTALKRELDQRQGAELLRAACKKTHGALKEVALAPLAAPACPICHRPDCDSGLANCTERWR